MKTGVILIIDDDEGIREILKVILEDEGYQTLSAKDGLEALELLRKIPEPSLILLDFMMPIMDGRQFMQALRKDNVLAKISSPIILITAFSDVKLGGMSGILQKPLEMNELLNIANKYCVSSNFKKPIDS